jgi:hypothetical protein
MSSARVLRRVAILLTLTESLGTILLQNESSGGSRTRDTALDLPPSIRAAVFAQFRASVAICEDLIRDFASRTSGPIPLGINVESVSIRRADIDAAESLGAFARRELDAHV